MKITFMMTNIIAAILVAGSPAISAPKTNTTVAPAQLVVTVRPAPGDNRSDSLDVSDLRVLRGNIPAPVIRLERLSGDLADMQLFVLLDEQQDTIMSGIIYFWVDGSWELAIVVFIASFLVPLFKLVSLIILTVSARRRSSWQRLQRAKLYRVVESIGRWSMLDVFVVSLLTGLVQIEGFAKITAGVGVAAFGSVVVLTMLASLSFDPRLIWDQDVPVSDENTLPSPHADQQEQQKKDSE